MTKRAEAQEAKLKWGLWVGFLGAPAAWLFNLQTNLTLVPWTCAHGKFFLVHLSSLFFLGLALSAGFLVKASCRAVERAPEAGKNEGIHQVSHFMSVVGLWMSALFSLLIIAQAIPTFILSPCLE